MSILQRAGTLLGWNKTPGVLRAEIEEEIRFHLEEREHELIAGGMEPEEARSRARELFGDVERTALECLTIQTGALAMLQRIQWGVIAVLTVCLCGLAWKHYETLRTNEAKLAALRMQQEKLLEQARSNAVLVAESDRALAEQIASEGSTRSNQAPVDPEPPSPSAVTEYWRARYQVAPEDWRTGLATAKALLSELSAAEAMRVLTEIWPSLSVAHKQQSLKAFAFDRGQAAVLAAMHLGATDASLEVQNWALSYVRDYALQSFSEDYEGYLAWYAEWGGQPLDEVLAGNAQKLIHGLLGRSLDDTDEILRDFKRLDLRAGEEVGLDMPAILRDAGALVLMEEWLVSDDGDALERAFSWAPALSPGEEWMRQHILPFVERPGLSEDEHGSTSSALYALASPGNEWAIPAILEFMERRVLHSNPEVADSAIGASARALATIGDPATIPTMIGLIASNSCYDTVYGIGYFGLGKLTGVSYDETHDGDWWIDWWQRNLGRFPHAVRTIPIPDYSSQR